MASINDDERASQDLANSWQENSIQDKSVDASSK